MNVMTKSPLRIVLHAPTVDALSRARSNVANLKTEDPALDVRIVLNAEAVAAALDNPNGVTDRLTLVCANTLKKIGREAPQPFTVLPEGAVLGLAQLQADGWTYIRS